MAIQVPEQTRAMLLDIEGTTTSIAFVYETLFPFARAHMAAFLEANWEDDQVQADVALARAQAAEDLQDGVDGVLPIPDGTSVGARLATVHNLLGQMDADRKTTGLKSLQGKIWLDGYARGELLAHLFEDVPPALASWNDQGLAIYIYSSGSIAAQKLLFKHSVAGDLTPLLAGYFDTTTGPKKVARSYASICAAVRLDPAQVCFLTDNLEEACAAREAGLSALLSVRPGNPTLAAHSFATLTTFAELERSP